MLMATWLVGLRTPVGLLIGAGVLLLLLGIGLVLRRR